MTETKKPDIVQRLHEWRNSMPALWYGNPAIDDAAAEIERLRNALRAQQAEPGADERDDCPELPTPFISVWADSDAEDCRLDVCYTPSAPRRDGTYATKLYTAEQMRAYARAAQSGQRAGVAEPEGWREFITEVAQQKPEKPDYWSSCGQCQHNADRAQDLIAAAPTQQQEGG